MAQGRRLFHQTAFGFAQKSTFADAINKGLLLLEEILNQSLLMIQIDKLLSNY